MINIAVFGGTILYCIVVNNILGFNNWWVNSCFAFFIGIYWASYKEKYAITLKDKNKIIRYAIMLSIILFLFTIQAPTCVLGSLLLFQ